MRFIRRVRNYLRFGKIRSEIKSYDNGHVSEIAYYDRKGKMVGYWAYGHFEPYMPYQG
jgi:hypothetical protein